MKACSGNWVGLCSGDDLLLNNYVNDIIKIVQLHDDSVFVMGAWEYFSDLTAVTKRHYLLSVNKYTKYPKTLQLQLKGPKASFAAFAFSKVAFEKVRSITKTII